MVSGPLEDGGCKGTLVQDVRSSGTPSLVRGALGEATSVLGPPLAARSIAVAGAVGLAGGFKSEVGVHENVGVAAPGFSLRARLGGLHHWSSGLGPRPLRAVSFMKSLVMLVAEATGLVTVGHLLRRLPA